MGMALMRSGEVILIERTRYVQGEYNEKEFAVYRSVLWYTIGMCCTFICQLFLNTPLGIFILPAVQ